MDLWGRHNDTIRVEHDFNHLEKLDGHLGWEWEDAIRCGRPHDPATHACSCAPRRSIVPVSRAMTRLVIRPYSVRARGSGGWQAAGPSEKPYGVMYVGSNWQRWEQVRRFLEGYARVRREVGQACLDRLGLGPTARLGRAERYHGDQHRSGSARRARCGGAATVSDLMRSSASLDKARFAPVFHRPLFRHLGFVTGRTFETFYADSLPGPDAAARFRGGSLRHRGPETGAG